MEKQPEVVGFSPDLAVKIADMVRQTEGTKLSVASGGIEHRVTYGEVSTAATAGTEASPTGGKFKMRDMFSSGTATSLDANAIDFTNPYEEAFAVGWTGLFVDTGFAWVPVLSGTATSGTGYGTLSSALASTDTTASITLNASSPLEPSASISATNWVGMDGAVGAKCIVNKQGSEWILVQLACPSP